MNRKDSNMWTVGTVAAGEALWQGRQFENNRQDWRIQLDDGDLAEIRRAIASLRKSSGLCINEMTDDPAHFPLHKLSGKLAGIAEQLKHGRGFAVLGGLPTDAFSSDELAAVFRGLTAHLGGVCVSQNYRGDLVGKVMDRSDEIADPRRYEAGGEFRMHIDPIDIVGLMCVRKAKQGGESRIVSALAVHNAILQERPDLLQVLYEGFQLFRPYPDRGRSPALTAEKVPFFAADREGGFAAYFLPDPVLQAVEREGVRCTALEREALEYAEQVAARPQLRLSMQLLPGDMQFLNNRKILHSRAAYEDHPEMARRRLMLRIWLMQPEWPALSARQRFFDEADKAGGGIPMQKPTQQVKASMQ